VGEKVGARYRRRKISAAGSGGLRLFEELDAVAKGDLVIKVGGGKAWRRSKGGASSRVRNGHEDKIRVVEVPCYSSCHCGRRGKRGTQKRGRVRGVSDLELALL